MKNLITVLLLIPLFSFSQIYTLEEDATRQQFVDAVWLPGTIIDNNGQVLEGQVRGYVYKGNEVQSFRYRTEKGAKAVTYKADDCQQVVYDGLIVISLPKNFKKPQGKKQFYVCLYHGKNFSVLQDPKASIAGSSSLNFGQMLNFLGLKNNQLYKISKLNFKKQIKKILSDNKEWLKKTNDKKWFKYNNIFDIAAYYDETSE